MADLTDGAWEYKVANLGAAHADGPVALQERLNELGDEGWDLVERIEGDGLLVVFKRPKRKDARKARLLN